MENHDLAMCSRLMQLFVVSFAYIYVIAKLIGRENKNKWFRKRTKYTFFNRRGFLGEYINFGYPVSWQGILIFIAMFGVIFGVGYWYLFVYSY